MTARKRTQGPSTPLGMTAQKRRRDPSLCSGSNYAEHHKAGLVGPAFLLWNWLSVLLGSAGQNVDVTAYYGSPLCEISHSIFRICDQTLKLDSNPVGPRYITIARF